MDLRCALRRKHGQDARRADTEREFESLARRCGDDLVVNRGWLGDDVVGFIVFLRRGDILYGRTAGFDYDRIGSHDFCQFNLTFYETLAWALPRGVRVLDLGLGAYPGKRTRGCRFTPAFGLFDLPAGSPARAVVAAQGAPNYDACTTSAASTSPATDHTEDSTLDVTQGDVWVDGQVLPGDKTTTSLLNPSGHYGWGAYEGVRFYPLQDPRRPGPLIFLLDEHLVVRSGPATGYPRSTVSPTPAAMSVAAQAESPRVSIGCWLWSGYLPDPAAGIRVRTSGWTRTGPSQIPPTVKSTGGYLRPSLARLEAVRDGDHEAILLNAAGRAAETSAATVFVVADGQSRTPPLAEGILPGITRASLPAATTDLGIATVETPLAPADLRMAGEDAA